MSSIAILAHTAGPAFNTDLYVATAAIIPTLFVAIAVQHGGMYYILTSAAAASRDAKERGNPPWRGRVFLLFAWTWVIFAFVVLCAGVAGEVAAIGGLSRHNDSSFWHFVMVASVYVLTGGVAIGAVARLIRTLWEIIRPASSQSSGEQPGGPQPLRSQPENERSPSLKIAVTWPAGQALLPRLREHVLLPGRAAQPLLIFSVADPMHRARR